MASVIQEEQANFARAARIILDLNTVALREYLFTVTPPTSLPPTIVNLNKLNRSQKIIVRNIFNIKTYDECDSSLLYILIRNVCNITPASGWDKPVQQGDQDVADDVERMRVLRNNVYGHATTARMSHGDYNSFIQNIRAIMIRFDSCHGGTYTRCIATGSYTNELNNIISSLMDPALLKHYQNHFVQLGVLSNEVTNQDIRIDNVDAKIDSVSNDMANQDTRIDNVDAKINSVSNYMANQDTRIDNVDAKINSVSNDMANQDTRIDNVDAKINSVSNDMANQDTRIDNVDAKISKEIRIQETRIDSIKMHFLTHGRKIDSVSQDVKNKESRICSIEKDLMKKDTKINTVIKDVETLNAKIKQSPKINNRHRHDLDYVYRMDWMCDLCNVKYKNTKSCYCVLCNHDECFSCYKEHENELFDYRHISDYQFTDNNTSHHHIIDNTWRLCCHHNESIESPIKVLRNFNRNDFFRDDKNQELYESGFTNYYTESEFDEELQDRFISTFSPDLKKQPWLLTNFNRDAEHGDKGFYDVCEEIMRTNHRTKYSFLLTDYKLEEHVQKLGVGLSKMKKELMIYEQEDAKCRVLLYRGTSKTLFILRYTDSTCKDDIVNEVVKGQNDAKLFSVLHMKSLIQFNITVVSLVITGNLRNEELIELDVCRMCTNERFVISSNNFTSQLEHIENKVMICTDSSAVHHDVEASFLSLASRIIGFISIEDVHLPNIFKNDAEMLTRIYLNKQQREFLHSKRRHAILQGGFGSGKTILAQLRLQHILQTGDPEDYMYFIIHIDEALLRNMVIHQVEQIKNKRLKPENIFIMNGDEYCERFGLIKPLMVTDILQDIIERHLGTSGRPHLIMDELDGSNLGKTEAHDVKNYLTHLYDSNILLVTHSMETIRKKVESKYLFLKDKQYYDGFNYTGTGMKITILDHTMRNSTSINALSQQTILTLKKCKNVFYERRAEISEVETSVEDDYVTDRNIAETSLNGEDSLVKEDISGMFRKEENTKEEKNDTYQSQAYRGLANVNFNRFNETEYSQEFIHSNQILKENIVVENRNIYVIPQNSSSKESNDSIIDTNVKKESLNKPLIVGTDKPIRLDSNKSIIQKRMVTKNIDHVLKHLNETPQTKTGIKLVSKFRFPGEWSHGHGMKGKLPLLVYPFEDKCVDYSNVNDPEIRARITYVLMKVVHLKSPIYSFGIICFEIIDSLLLYEVLISLGFQVFLYTPAMDTSTKPIEIERLNHILQTNVVITDHMGARGMEYRSLLLSLNPNENCLHQYLLEGLTRCISQLYIIVIRKGLKLKRENITCGDIIEDWVKKGLVRKQIIQVCTNTHEDDEWMGVVCKEDDVRKVIHPWHKEFDFHLVEIKEVKINVTECIEEYKIFSKTNHVEEKILRKQCEQRIQQECARKGYSTYIDVIRENNVEIIDYLMKNMYEDIVSFRDKKGNTLLHIALQIDADESAISFIKNNMPTDIPNEHNMTAMDLAKRLNKNRIINVKSNILRKEDWRRQYNSVTDKYGYVGRMMEENRKEELDFILEEFTEVTDEWIRRYNASVDKNHHVGRLIRERRSREVMHLVKVFPDISKLPTGENCDPILHIAAGMNNVIVLKELIVKGADVFALDYVGRNVLYYVIKNGSDNALDCLAYLLETYPKLMQVKCSNETVLEYAKKTNKSKITNMLNETRKELSKKVSEKINQECERKGLSSLHDIFEGNHTDVIEKLVTEMNDELMSFRDENGESLLHLAVKHDSIPIIEILIKEGMSMNILNEEGETPVEYAKSSGRTEIVKILWKYHYKSTSNKYDYVGRLMKGNRKAELDFISLEFPEVIDEWSNKYDVSYDKHDHVEQLINEKRNEEMIHLLEAFPDILQLRNYAYNNAPIFHYAARVNNMVVMKELIDRGADVYAVDNSDYNVLHNVVFNGSDDALDCFAYLAETYPKLIEMKKIDKDETPLEYAKALSKEKMAKVLEETIKRLSNKVNERIYQECERKGLSSLHDIFGGVHTDVIVKLVTEINDELVYFRDENGHSILHLAVKYDSIPIIEMLIKGGMSMNILNEEGETPVEYAKSSGRTELVDILRKCQYNAAPDKYNHVERLIKEKRNEEVIHILNTFPDTAKLSSAENDKTIIFIAVLSNNMEVMIELICKGADVYAVDNSDYNVLHDVVFNGSDDALDCFAYLAETYPKLMEMKMEYKNATPLEHAKEEKKHEMIKVLEETIKRLSKKVSEKINQECERKGLFSLHDIFEGNHTDVIEKLVTEMNDELMYFRDENGESLLHLAVKYDSIPIIEILIKEDMSMNILNEEGETPVEYAKSSGRTEIVKILWKYHYKSTSNRYDYVGRLMKGNRKAELDFISLEFPEVIDEWSNKYDVSYDKHDHVEQLINEKRNEEMIHLLKAFPDILQLRNYAYNNAPIFHYAARVNNMVVMKELIDRGADVYAVNELSHNVLHDVVLNGNDDALDCFAYLAQTYPKLMRMEINYNSTPLEYAKIKKTLKMVKLLEDTIMRLSNNVNERIRKECGRKGLSSLQDVFQGTHTDVIDTLITEMNEEFVYFRDGNGESLLHLAVKYNSISIIEMLIERGMSIDILNEEGKTPMEYAKSSGIIDLVDTLWKCRYNAASDKYDHIKMLIIEECNEEVTFLLSVFTDICKLRHVLYDYTLLHIAAKMNNMVVMQELIEKGADVFALDYDGHNVLHQVIRNGSNDEIECFSYLANTYPKLMEMKHKEHGTPLEYAIEEKKDKKVKVLIETKKIVVKLLSNKVSKRINQECECKGLSSLQDIFQGNHTDVIDTLITEINDEFVYFRDGNGDSLLHLAVKYNSISIIEMLIEGGMSIDILNDKGKTPIDDAKSSGKTELVFTLWKSQYNAAFDTYDHVARLIDKEQNEEVIHLLKVYPDIKCLKGGKYDEPLLHVAAWENNMIVMHALIDAGADIYAIDNENDNVLDNVVLNGSDDSLDCFKYLAETYPKLMQMGMNKTPLEYAKEEKKHAMIKMFEEIMKNIGRHDEEVIQQS